MGEGGKPVRHTIEPELQSLGVAAAEPTCHNCWSPRALEPVSITQDATVMKGPQTTAREEPRLQWRQYSQK